MPISRTSHTGNTSFANRRSITLQREVTQYNLLLATWIPLTILLHQTFQMRLYINTNQKNFTSPRLATLTPGRMIFFIGACNIEFEESDFRIIPYFQSHWLLAFGVIFNFTLDTTLKRPAITTPKTTPSKRQRAASPTSTPSIPSFGTSKEPMTTPPPHHSEEEEKRGRSETPTPAHDTDKNISDTRDRFTRKRKWENEISACSRLSLSYFYCSTLARR